MLLVFVVRDVLLPLEDDPVQEGLLLLPLKHVQRVVNAELSVLLRYLLRHPHYVYVHEAATSEGSLSRVPGQVQVAVATDISAKVIGIC